MKRVSLALVAAAVTVFGLGSLANASVIVSPVSVTATPPGVFPPSSAGALIDQSGLSAGYTSGVTDFSTFVATTTHVNPSIPANFGTAYISDPPGLGNPPPVNLDFDFGSPVSLTQLALWNDTDSQAVNSFSVFSATDGTFATTTLLGTFNATQNPFLLTVPAEVFDFTDATAQFFRMTVNTTFPGGGRVHFGEVAFEQALEGPLPEPGTLSLFGLGLAGMGLMGSRRRRRQPSARG